MKITYRQSGGFAGIAKGCEIALEGLPAGEREPIRDLVRRALAAGPVEATSKQARDLIMHEVQIEHDGKIDRFVVDDLSAPEALRPLLQFLQKRAKAAPPK